jgi:hypothetical protein
MNAKTLDVETLMTANGLKKRNANFVTVKKKKNQQRLFTVLVIQDQNTKKHGLITAVGIGGITLMRE